MDKGPKGVFDLQPTYEGLKLLLRKMKKVAEEKFAAYLRGIETKMRNEKGEMQMVFAAYLRGIETLYLWGGNRRL